MIILHVISHIIYILSLVLFVFFSILFNKKKKEYSSFEDQDKETEDFDNAFIFPFLSVSALNVLSLVFLLVLDNYFETLPTSFCAPLLFFMNLAFTMAHFSSLLERSEKAFNKDEAIPFYPKEKRSIRPRSYDCAFFASCIIPASFPSYILFGIIRPNIDLSSLNTIIPFAIVSVISIYEIVFSIYRILQNKKKTSSYLSFAISMILQFVSIYCYSLLSDYCFAPIAGAQGSATFLFFVIIIILILDSIVSTKSEKKLFKDKKQYVLKDGIRIYEITNINLAVILPIASVLYYVLTYFNLIEV